MCVRVLVPYTEIFIVPCVCAHGQTRVVSLALCLSGHSESCVCLQCAIAFLHCYHFLGELSSSRETERGKEKERIGWRSASSLLLEQI